MLSIVIPVFNEEQIIDAVMEDVLRVFPDNEIIVVNDGSIDNTRERLEKYASRAMIITLEENRGYGFALKKGIERAKSEYVGLMDSDGQHSALDLQRLWEHHKGEDLIVGARTKQSHFYLVRRPGKYILKEIAEYLTSRKIPDLNSGMRILRRELVISYFYLLPNSFSFSTTITVAMLKDDCAVSFHPIVVTKRTGKSTVKVSHGFQTIVLLLRLIMLFEPLKIFLPLALMGFSTFLVWAGAEFLRFHAFGATSVMLSIMTLLIIIVGLLADQIAIVRKQLHQQ